jgi:hypothetical protein
MVMGMVTVSFETNAYCCKKEGEYNGGGSTVIFVILLMGLLLHLDQGRENVEQRKPHHPKPG